jgi:nucleotide-binding universal stress UspA family protein
MDDAKIRRILVPTDFSDAAGEAVQAAVVLARAFDAGIELLHVTATVAFLPPPADLVPLSVLMPDLSKQVRERLTEEGKRVQAAGIPCETNSREGSPHTEIVERAQEMGADLIVMGTHGHGGVAHAVLGSVTERVLHKSRCPVLVVPLSR